MIIETVFAFFCNSLISLMSFVNIGHLSLELMTKFYSVLDLLFENLGLIGLFIRPSSLVTVSLIMLAIYEFDKLYSFYIWVQNRMRR